LGRATAFFAEETYRPAMCLHMEDWVVVAVFCDMLYVTCAVCSYVTCGILFLHFNFSHERMASPVCRLTPFQKGLQQLLDSGNGCVLHYITV
jgi:hypothetical protein